MSGILFNYGGKLEAAHATRDLGGPGGDVSEMERQVLNIFDLPPGTYHFQDGCGRVKEEKDLRRAAARGDCELKVQEHLWFIRVREQGSTIRSHSDVLEKIPLDAVASEERSTNRTNVAQQELTAMIKKLEMQISNKIMPTLEDLCRDRTQLQRETRQIMEKLSGINVQELRDISAQAASLHEEVKAAVKRVDKIDASFNRDKAIIFEDVRKNEQDLRELQRYMQGKIDVCIDADGDLRHQQQLLNERGQIVADDLRLLQEDLRSLTQRCAGGLEESEELRTLLGQVREDNRHLSKETGDVRSRIHCIEGAASEKWAGFSPGVMYFRRWHVAAKGSDVQLDSELKTATGRGFMAAMGVVIGNNEGLAVADGPCRRFGTPGHFSSYFEVLLNEITHAPAGAGGLYVGVALQTADEILAHPRKEFDGWLIGGPGKALICRRSTEVAEDDLADIQQIPGTFAVSGAEVPQDAVQLLRRSLPPRPKGEVRAVEGGWTSEDLRMGQKLGILFACNRDGGARLRISVEGEVAYTHEFIDAPPAEAVGFLTPVIRMAGTGKSVRILPGMQPPAKMLAD